MRIHFQIRRPHLAMVAGLLLLSPGCYSYHEQSKVVIPNIDIDQTLQVARVEMAQNKMSTVLTIWAIRDQVFTTDQAHTVSQLYFKHIERIDSDVQKARKFSVWHLTWAISNMYRLGDPAVKTALRNAYEDAEKRVEKLDRNIAKTHFRDEKIYMGDIHFGGRAYAKSHLVVPGNDDYLDSFEAYLEDNEDSAPPSTQP